MQQSKNHISLCASTWAIMLSLAITPAYAGGIWDDPFNAADELHWHPAPTSSCQNHTATKLDLTLHSAIDVALCRNPETRAAWAQAKARSANLAQSRSSYLPTLTFNANAQRLLADNRSNTLTGSSRYSGNQTTSTSQLSLEYLLYDFGGRESTVESARQSMLEAGWTANSTMQGVVYQAVKAYAAVFSSQESLEAATQTAEAAKAALEAASAREAVGVVTAADTSQAKTAYAQSMLEKEKAQNALSLATGDFARLLHYQPTTDITLAPLAIQAKQPSFDSDVQSLIAKARSARPDLAASRARRARAEAELQKAEARNYPSLALNAYSANTDYLRSNTSTHDSAIELSVSIPIFTGFSNHYQIASARNSLEAATADTLKTEDDVTFDVWTAYHNHQTALRSYDIAETLITSATDSQALTLGRYKEGIGTLIDALNAQAQLANARRGWVDARYNVLVTRYDLARAIGVSTTQDDALSNNTIQ